MSAVLIALSSPVDADREDPFLKWYLEVHAPEIRAAIPEITTFSQVRLTRPDGSTPRYLARYEAPTLDAATLAQRLGAASESLTMSEHMTVEGEDAPQLHFGEVVA